MYPNTSPSAALLPSPHVLRSPDGSSWAYLRAARFFDRPGHSDQLHLDLWWRGLNVAQDAGTYLYNAPPPWDNALARTQVHNTVSVDGREQMQRAGRFLYLDWAQAQVTAADGTGKRLVARHNGYRSLGVIHQRTLNAVAHGGWVVEDRLSPERRSSDEIHSACLHWLLPDWPYELQISDSRFEIRVQSPYGWVELGIDVEAKALISAPGFQLVRAGQLVRGSGSVDPTWGWSSPTYGDKIPAIALRLSAAGSLPLVFTSHWSFPASQN